MTEYPYTGFRFSCLAKGGEFYNCTTCRYVKPEDALRLSEDDRVCGMPSAQDANGLVLPACEKHKELYEVLKKTFISIGQDKEKFAELLKPQPLTCTYGVDMSRDFV